MRTAQFLDQLEQQGEKVLRFQYAPGKEVALPYHVTEVKSVHIQSVDCGGNAHEERLTVVQLWVDAHEAGQPGLTAAKVRSIIAQVEDQQALDHEAEIRFEYGDEHFHTATLAVSDIEAKADSMRVNMQVPATQCKPRLVKVGDASCCGSSASTSCCN